MLSRCKLVKAECTIVSRSTRTRFQDVKSQSFGLVFKRNGFKDCGLVKTSVQVSEDCKEQLNRRQVWTTFKKIQTINSVLQVMAAEDYKSDVSLTSACGQELAVLQCANKEEKEDGVHVAVQLSTVLLCLEAGVREEKVKVTTCFSKCNLIKFAPTGRGSVHL